MCWSSDPHQEPGWRGEGRKKRGRLGRGEEGEVERMGSMGEKQENIDGISTFSIQLILCGLFKSS